MAFADNLWPVVAPLLQQRYHEAYRARLAEYAQAYPQDNIKPWPLRRSSRRRPIPGVLDVAAWDEG